MLRNTILFFTLLLVALLAGRAFWAWVGENPANVSGPAYVESFQALNKAIEAPIEIIGIGAAAFAGISTVFAWRERPALYLWLAAFACILVANVVTVRVNLPINYQIASFNPAALPADWPELRDRWWAWHLVRTGALLPGMCLVFLAVLLRKEPHQAIQRI